MKVKLWLVYNNKKFFGLKESLEANRSKSTFTDSGEDSSGQTVSNPVRA